MKSYLTILITLLNIIALFKFGDSKHIRQKRGYYEGYEYEGPYPPSLDYAESDTPPPNPDDIVTSKEWDDHHPTNIDMISLTSSGSSDTHDESAPYSYEPPKIHDEPPKSLDDHHPTNVDTISITTSGSSDINESEPYFYEPPKIHDEPPKSSDDHHHHHEAPSVKITENSIELDIKPNKELLAIADKKIQEFSNEPVKKIEPPKIVEHKEEKPKVPNSYGVPLSSVTGYPPYVIASDHGEAKEISKPSSEGPPATSYGVPDKKIPKPTEIKDAKPGPPATLYGVPDKIIPKPEKPVEKEVKKPGPPAASYGVPDKAIPKPEKEDVKPGPPATSYGVPDKEISHTVNKKSVDNSRHVEDDARSYNFTSSSYDVPLKSITTLPDADSIESIGIPEVKINVKFNPNDDDNPSASIDSDDSFTNDASTKNFVMVPLKHFNIIRGCMEKALGSSLVINGDKILVKQ